MDNGADLVSALHTERKDLLGNVIGKTEETTTGVIRFRSMASDGVLGYPIVAVSVVFRLDTQRIMALFTIEKANSYIFLYNTNYYGLNTFFITNSTESNYTTLYSVPNNKEGEIRRYELLDVCVTDDWGDPVSGATVTISVDNPDGTDLCSINRLLEELTQTTTLSNGHTPLPCEDQAATIALLRFLKTDTFEQSGFSYSISVEKGAMNAEATDVMPNSAWYRIDPDTYENTVLITLARIEGDTDVDGDVDGSDLALLAQNYGSDFR